MQSQSIFLLLRSLCFAGAAAAVAACSGGATSGTALPPQDSTPAPVQPGATTLSTTAAPALAQSANGSAYAPSSITVKFPSTPAAGHVLVVAFSNNGNSSGAANLYYAPSGWSVAGSNTAHAYHTYEIFTHVVASGEANSYTFKPAYAQREHTWMAADVANAKGVDKHGSAYVSSTSYTTPTLYASQTGDLALAFNMPSTNSASWSNSSGWTRNIGPTATWSQEGVTQSLSSTSTSEHATLSTSSAGFASMVLLSPGAGSTTGATPAPTSAPTTAPTSAPTTSPTSVPVSSGVATYHGCPLYTANDWFTTNLVTGGSSYVPNTVDPSSANIINNIATNVGKLNFAAESPTNLEAANIDPESSSWFMTTVNGRAYGWANDSYNDDPNYQMPVTNGTYFQEGNTKCNISGGDCHVVVLDTVKCVDYETYKSGTYGGFTGSWNGSTYYAEGGGVENLNHAYHIEPIAVDAADIPMMGTTDWGEDLQYQKSSCQPNCAIPHILAFFMPYAGQANGHYVDPAGYEQHTCSSYCTYPLPEGARLRLHSSYPCPSPSTNPQGNLICNQMKQYGIILNDFVGLTDVAGVRLGLSSDGSDPWNSSDYNALLNNVHITDFDVMKLGTLHG